MGEEKSEDGIRKGKEETAKNALTKGASIEYVKEITGLNLETIKKLGGQQNT